MPTFQEIFPFILLLLPAYFAWRYFKNGSLVGALLDGRLTETFGEISLPPWGLSSRVLRVSLMATPQGAPKDIAVAITSKAPFAASVVAFKLSHAQALELLTLLQRATAR
jgi:hypothetical protein